MDDLYARARQLIAAERPVGDLPHQAASSLQRMCHAAVHCHARATNRRLSEVAAHVLKDPSSVPGRPQS